jgi:hypothetical protein
MQMAKQLHQSARSAKEDLGQMPHGLTKQILEADGQTSRHTPMISNKYASHV